MDRSLQSYSKVISELDSNHESYLAVLLQDVPDNIRTECLGQRSNKFRLEHQEFVAKSVSGYLAMMTALNENMAFVVESHRIGNEKAAGTVLEIRTRQAPPQGTIFLVNIYIKPTASYAEATMLLSQIVTKCRGRMSKVIIAGDVNASSPLWDPNHDKIEESARISQGYYQTKLQRGSTIAEFIRRHQLKAIQQATKQPKPTFKNGRNDKGSHIDVVIAGNKTERLWTEVWVIESLGKPRWPKTQRDLAKRSNEHTLSEGELAPRHKYILLNHKAPTNTRHNKPTLRQFVKPELIEADDFLAIRYRVKNLRKNWMRTADQGELIGKL